MTNALLMNVINNNNELKRSIQHTMYNLDPSLY